MSMSSTVVRSIHPPESVPKKKKKLTPEERARESAKRKGRRQTANARDEAAAAAAIAATRVAAATMDALLYLGLNPGQHGLTNTVVAAASTCPCAFPRMVLPESPRVSATHLIPSFHISPEASQLYGECSPEVSVVAPSTPAPIDLNATPVAGGSSSGGARKRAWHMPADVLPGTRNLFDGMPASGEDD